MINTDDNVIKNLNMQNPWKPMSAEITKQGKTF